MLGFILKRLLWMIPTILIISIISFFIIQLPPGDYLTSWIAALEETGEEVSVEQAIKLREQYHLDDPFYKQYSRWMGFNWFFGGEKGLLQGYMGRSFEYNRPVTELIGERILLTMLISICTLFFAWSIAIPIGIYSACRQYSPGDYAFTFLGFVGMATPNFLLALIVMYVGYSVFGVSAGGLFSAPYENAPWNFAKFIDLAKPIWVPVIVIGVAGTAGLIRVMRANLLDELRKQYVVTAQAKGVSPIRLLMKYPVRVALNPIISTVGWLLPTIVSGSTITAVVLGLPTTGPLLLSSLLYQDMYLAGSMVMMLSSLTVIGTLLSDILLAIVDPRIRYEKRGR